MYKLLFCQIQLPVKGHEYNIIIPLSALDPVLFEIYGRYPVAIEDRVSCSFARFVWTYNLERHDRNFPTYITLFIILNVVVLVTK